MFILVGENRLTYKLLVNLETEKPLPYKGFLCDREAVNGISTRFKIGLKNLSEKDFPGGSFVLSFDLETGMETMSVEMPSVSLASLGSSKSFAKRGTIRFPAPGIWKAILKVKSNDSGKVEFCFPHMEGTSADCTFPIYVIDRIQIELLSTLTDLSEKEGIPNVVKNRT